MNFICWVEAVIGKRRMLNIISKYCGYLGSFIFMSWNENTSVQHEVQLSFWGPEKLIHHITLNLTLDLPVEHYVNKAF